MVGKPCSLLQHRHHLSGKGLAEIRCPRAGPLTFRHTVLLQLLSFFEYTLLIEERMQMP